MRLGAGDVFGIEALVVIDRGIDAPHDLGRTAGKAAAPLRIGRFVRAGHGPASREDETMKWTVAAALMFLLAAPAPAATDAGDADIPDRTKLGEFVPSSQPFAAPTISLTDSDGHTSRFRQFQLNIDPADRMDELKLDVTAPMMAARPSRPTERGTACGSRRGMIAAVTSGPSLNSTMLRNTFCSSRTLPGQE